MDSTLLLQKVDHLLFGVPDLATGIEEIERLLGIRAEIGGKHVGLGTHNALLSLGKQCYLEIIAPDPEQKEFRRPRLFDLDDLTSPRLLTWVAKGDDLEQLSALELGSGEGLGEVLSGSRLTPDGSRLTWRFTDPFAFIADGLVPFFIDWGESPHPASSAVPGAVLLDLRAEHPEPEDVQGIYHQLDLPVSLSKGPEPALVATIESPNGRVELR